MDTTVEALRAELERARQAAHAGNMAAVLRELDNAIASLNADRLLTTMEAAHLLGIHSPNTVLAWCRTGYVRGVQRGGRTLIPLSEVERIGNGDPVRATRAADRLHDRAATLGADEAMSEAEMEQLHEARPGTLPWERAHEATG